MHKNREVAKRHLRQPHYHHRVPVTSNMFQKRFNHLQYKYDSSINSFQIENKKDHSSENVFEASTKKKLFNTKSDKKKKPGNKKNVSKKAKKKHGKHYALKKFIAKLIIVALIFWAVLKFVFGIEILYGNYMYPAIRDGDLVISYKLQSPITNDVVMYEHNGETRLGRVVAKENSVIKYNSETETYSVNDVTPSESIFYTTVVNPDADIEYPYTVPQGCLYILNDHREEYTDSRTYEAIPLSDVKGVVIFVIRRRGF